MPARILRQRGAVKEAFQRFVVEKKARRHQARQRKIDEELPGFIAAFLKPLAGAAARWRERQNENKGEDGETYASLGLWLFLPRTWILMNDIVIQTGPAEFAQIDHLALGPGGLFLVETKNWQGALLVKGDDWFRKSGRGWTRVQSPTRQHRRHKDVLLKWLKGKGFPVSEEAVHAVVLIRGASWLKAEDATMPIFEGTFSLAWHIRQSGKKGPGLSQDLALTIAQSLQEAEPSLAQGLPEAPPTEG